MGAPALKQRGLKVPLGETIRLQVKENCVGAQNAPYPGLRAQAVVKL
jgi:hypothetical protein